MLNFKITFLTIFLSIQLLLAQKINQPEINNCELSFSKHINTWFWHGGFDIQKINLDGVSFYIRDKFLSNLQISYPNAEDWRDDNKLSAYFYKNLTNTTFTEDILVTM